MNLNFITFVHQFPRLQYFQQICNLCIYFFNAVNYCSLIGHKERLIVPHYLNSLMMTVQYVGPKCAIHIPQSDNNWICLCLWGTVEQWQRYAPCNPMTDKCCDPLEPVGSAPTLCSFILLIKVQECSAYFHLLGLSSSLNVITDHRLIMHYYNGTIEVLRFVILCILFQSTCLFSQ